MKRKTHPKSHRLDVAAQMPLLRHTVGGQFDCATSEVATWLVNQPTIRDYLFRAIARNGLIVYDKTTGTWQGKDYKAPPPIVF